MRRGCRRLRYSHSSSTRVPRSLCLTRLGRLVCPGWAASEDDEEDDEGEEVDQGDVAPDLGRRRRATLSIWVSIRSEG